MDTKTYKLSWSFDHRITNEHFGKQKYTSVARALGELVANSLDAGATVVDVTLAMSDLSGVEKITVTDNGRGITPDDLKRRFTKVGVRPTIGSASGARLGRLGVGRLAVFRIGGLSRWTSISSTGNDTRVQIAFEMRGEQSDKAFRVEESDVADRTPTGTTIEICNLEDNQREIISAKRIYDELLSQYCSYLLGNTEQVIRVQGEPLDVQGMIESSEEERIPEAVDVPEATIQHLVLNRPIDRSRFPQQIIFSALGRTVATSEPEDSPGTGYLAVVECPYLDSIVTSNREALVNMDGGFANLSATVRHRINQYSEKLQARRHRSFIESAREEEFYPYRAAPKDVLTHVEQNIYDVLLQLLNGHAGLERLTKRQLHVVFALLHRSIQSEDILFIIDQVLKLSEADTAKFRQVLEHTTLSSIVKLTHEVTERLIFLDMLHGLVYGPDSKSVKERTQLHKVLEPHCWLFGPQFHLATSDQGFREVVRQHRSKCGLESADEAQLAKMQGGSRIPDLFLAASKEYSVEPRDHHLLVEIKAPDVPMGITEVNQIHAYANIIKNSSHFDHSSTHWDIFLVSTRATSDIDMRRQMKSLPYGCIGEHENFTLWAFEWSEIIRRAKADMQIVRQHLDTQTQQLSVQDYFKANFPGVEWDGGK